MRQYSSQFSPLSVTGVGMSMGMSMYSCTYFMSGKKAVEY